MRKLVYYVGVSIDGYIAGPGGEFDFYPVGDDLLAWMTEQHPEVVPTHVRGQIGLDGPDGSRAPNRRFDTVVMGRGTYQPALDIGVTSPYGHLRQYVVSTTIPEISDPAVELVPGDPVGLVRRLKAEENDDGLDVWLCGGGRLAGALLPEIDEMIVKSYPVVAGAGVPMIDGDFQPASYSPADSRTFSNGARVTWYERT